MPANRSVPSAAVIARELDRLTIPTQQKKLPSTFLQSFSVKERLKDLSVDRLPEPNPSLDCACTKALTSAERTAVKLANDALLVFSRLAYLIEHDNPSLRSMMLQMWDSGAWKWMLFLYNSGVDLNESISNDSESERIPLTRQVVTVAIVDALVGCSDSATLGKRLIRVPDIVALTARLWVEDLPIPGRVSMVHKELTFAMYHIMSDSQDDTALSSLMDAVDGGADTIISAASNHLRRLASSTPLVLKDLNSQLQFMQFITKKPALRDAMHRGDTLSIALSVINALTKNSVKIPTGHEMLVSCLDAILLPHLLSGADVRPLIQSINNGLLRTIYDARVAFDRYEECRGALEEVVIQIVGPSLVFRSVLHAVERSENKTNFFASYRSGNSEFGEWETLHEVYQQMVRFKHSLDEHPAPCGFMDCRTNEVDMVIKLQRCGKCQYEKYCSQECQKKDWLRHKLYCRREDAGGTS
ncbi:hypothetical protein R3P38DRAFT_1719737 [Favolaschia claudopus]|uniref:MYND-type domain-containing protein n=1 Tax=Favolaschia claudopus TaxID=2862362 RepID=A0AAW0AAJ2_9AGAR